MARRMAHWRARFVTMTATHVGKGTYGVNVSLTISEGAPSQIGRQVEIELTPSAARDWARVLNSTADDAERYEGIRKGHSVN